METPVIQFDLILSDHKSASRKQLFEYIAHELAKVIGIGERVLFDKFMDKARQVNCSIGSGVAIADLRLSSLKEPLTVLIRASHQIDFSSADDEKVDLIGVMISPERDGPQHLARLSRFSRLLRDAQFCDSIRQYRKAEMIRRFLKEQERVSAALKHAA